MPFAEIYRRQAALLIRLIPSIAEEQNLALKGGTAINLFVRDMPRLSVDIDLTYMPVQSHAASVAGINAGMSGVAARIKRAIRGSTVSEGRDNEGTLTHLVARADGVQCEIEVTPVLRGCIYDPQLTSVAEAVEDAFGFAEMQVVSVPDLYAGKLVAALDRQHPRDFFDTRQLMGDQGIDDTLRQAFIVYLVSHRRPMHEVLRAKRKDMTAEFHRGFDGMTDEPATIEELIAAREELIADIVGKMPDKHRKFLVSFVRGKPDWSLLGLPAAAGLPAVKWRQLNLDKLSAEKRAAEVGELEKVLSS
jgi:predicted nucleotidyltransferase component of viral defense system